LFNGVTGWTDFSEQDDWANPVAGWTARFAQANTNANRLHRQEIIHARSLSGKVMLVDNVVDGFNGVYGGIISWDVPGALTGDIEVLMLMRGWTNNQHGLGYMEDLAPSGGLYTPSLAHGVHVNAFNSNPRLRNWQKPRASGSWGAGAFTDAGAPAAISSEKRYFMRVRLTATDRYRAKIWDADLAEPGAWQHDNTEAALVDQSGGFLGLLLSNWVSTASDPILIEYASVSNNPGTTPAPMPASLALMGGNFGSVDMATATVGAGGFVQSRIAGTAATMVMEARGGSKHGTVLRVTGAVSLPRGVAIWEPAGQLFNGDVLALIEIGVNSWAVGAGVAYPRGPNGSGLHDLAQTSFTMLRDQSNAMGWMGQKSHNTGSDFPLRVNVTGVTINAGERWWCRHRRTMHQIQCRVWKEGTAEPGTWQVDTTAQRVHDVVGTPAMGWDMTISAGSMYLEHLAWTDDPTANPVSPV
jgi:hypothetical protein